MRREFIPRFRLGPAALPAALAAGPLPGHGLDLALVRAEAIAALGGGLAEDLCPGWEAADLSLRVFTAGLECVYEPAATVDPPARAARRPRPRPTRSSCSPGIATPGVVLGAPRRRRGRPFRRGGHRMSPGLPRTLFVGRNITAASAGTAARCRRSTSARTGWPLRRRAAAAWRSSPEITSEKGSDVRGLRRLRRRRPAVPGQLRLARRPIRRLQDPQASRCCSRSTTGRARCARSKTHVSGAQVRQGGLPQIELRCARRRRDLLDPVARAALPLVNPRGRSAGTGSTSGATRWRRPARGRR